MPRRFINDEVTIDEESGWAEFADEADEELAHPEMLGPFKTDFQQMLEDHSKAKYIEGYGHVDDLAHAVNLRQQRGDAGSAEVVAGLPGAGSGSFITPKSVVTSGAVLGNQKLVTSGNEQDMCYWSGNDDEAMTMTVHTSLVEIQNGWPNILSTPPSGAVSYRPYCKVRWGTRGMAHEIKMDIGLGSTIVVSGSSLYVSCGMENAGGIAPVVGTMQIGATVGFFAASQATAPIRTVYIDGLGVSSTTNIIIPKFASTINWIVGVDNSGQAAFYTLRVKDVAGTVIMLYRFTSSATQPPPPIVLPADAYSIDVTNDSTSPVNLRAPFSLSI